MTYNQWLYLVMLPLSTFGWTVAIAVLNFPHNLRSWVFWTIAIGVPAVQFMAMLLMIMLMRRSSRKQP